MTLDYLNDDLQEGDAVVYVRPNAREFSWGFITKINAKKASILRHGKTHVDYKFYHDCIKIDKAVAARLLLENVQ